MTSHNSDLYVYNEFEFQTDKSTISKPLTIDTTFYQSSTLLLLSPETQESQITLYSPNDYTVHPTYLSPLQTINNTTTHTTTNTNQRIKARARKLPRSKQNKSQDSTSAIWNCVKCGVNEKQTPLKRKNTDGKRSICNACYVRNRVQAERAERGISRPILTGFMTPINRATFSNTLGAVGMAAAKNSFQSNPVYYQQHYQQPALYSPFYTPDIYTPTSAFQEVANMNAMTVNTYFEEEYASLPYENIQINQQQEQPTHQQQPINEHQHEHHYQYSIQQQNQQQNLGYEEDEYYRAPFADIESLKNRLEFH